MNALENLLDKKAALLNDVTEQNLLAFSIALLGAPLIIPCEFDFKDFNFTSLDPSLLKQGAVIPCAGPEYKTAVAECEGRKWLKVYTDKTSMPEQYRSSCIHTDGRGAASIVHEQGNIDGLMLDPEGTFIPVPVEYLDNVIQLIDDYKGDKMSSDNDSIVREDNKSNETEIENGSNEITDNVFDEAEDEESLEPVSLDLLEITDIAGFNGGFIIRWCSPEIGFGEYTIHTKVKRNQFGFAEDDVLIEGDSECMDSNEDKFFLKALLGKLVEKISIVS